MFFDEWNTALLWGLIIALNGNNKIDPRTKVINTESCHFHYVFAPYNEINANPQVITRQK